MNQVLLLLARRAILKTVKECGITVEGFFKAVSPVMEFDRLGKKYSDGDTEEACIAFTRQVSEAESAMHIAWRMTVQMTRTCDDLGAIAKCWQQYADLCDDTLRVLLDLKERFPFCGTPQLYDEVLDLRTKALERMSRVTQEQACQENQNLKGLFQSAM